MKRIGILNRGEVAVRIQRACRSLGMTPVLFHSTVDRQTKAYRESPESYELPGNELSQTYLNQELILGLLKESRVDAVHPGFGFLSENAEFAKRVIESGVIFVGPNPETIELLGSKSEARLQVKALGIPVVPGFEGDSASLETWTVEAKKIGFPLICKAAFGGGGRGLKVIRKESEIAEQIESSQRESLLAFGRSEILLEKYIENGKHIEVQIFGQADGTVVVLGDRDCSVQRRHQKIIEEGFAPTLSDNLRSKLYESARTLGKALGYRNAGTVEFLVEGDEFYFLEVNTRLQVEHPVTEEVMKIDLVRAQLLCAFGECDVSLNLAESELVKGVALKRHAIEVRICAESPFEGGAPSTGRIQKFEFQKSPFIRLELGFEDGDRVSGHYDSMVAKVIATGSDRRSALRELELSLETAEIFGIQTNIPLILKIIRHEKFVDGTYGTRFFETSFSESLISLVDEELKKKLSLEGLRHVSLENLKSNSFSIDHKDRAVSGQVALADGNFYFALGSEFGFETVVMPFHEASAWIFEKQIESQDQAASTKLVSPMPGRVLKVFVEAGDQIKLNQLLFVIEAMKMEYQVKSPKDGVVESLTAKEGGVVARGAQLAIIKKELDK